MKHVAFLAVAVLGLACGRSSSAADASSASSASVVVHAASSTPPPSAQSVSKTPLPPGLEAYDAADVVVVGTLIDPKIVSVLEIHPPIYVHELEIAVDERLAGGSVPARVKARFSSKTHPKPFPANTRMLVTLQPIEESLPKPSTRFEAKRVEVATPELEAKLRPALLRAPDGLALSVAQVPAPAGSPSEYGDGTFELTLRNDSSAPLDVPGVFTAAGAVQWAHALVIRDEAGRTLSLPHGPMPAGSTPLRLKPHEEVKTRGDMRPFGVVRPSGGERKTYSFAVGPIRTSSFFYYVDSYHGPMMGRP